MSIGKETFLKDIRQEELHVVDFMKVNQFRLKMFFKTIFKFHKIHVIF